MLHLPGGRLKRADADLSDLTARNQIGPPRWVPDVVDMLEVPFDAEPTAEEQKAIRRRLLTEDAAHEARVKAMQDALVELEASPTTPTELRDAVVLTLTVLLGDLA